MISAAQIIRNTRIHSEFPIAFSSKQQYSCCVAFSAEATWMSPRREKFHRDNSAHIFFASIEMFGIIALLLEPASLHDPQKQSVQSEIWRTVITEAFPFIRSATSIFTGVHRGKPWQSSDINPCQIPSELRDRGSVWLAIDSPLLLVIANNCKLPVPRCISTDFCDESTIAQICAIDTWFFDTWF